MQFEQVLPAIKEGNLAQRKDWMDRGVFVFMRPSDELDPEFIIKTVKSLPIAYKETLRNVTFQKGEKIKFHAYLCMKAKDNSIINGWTPSPDDLLADDWLIFIN